MMNVARIVENPKFEQRGGKCPGPGEHRRSGRDYVMLFFFLVLPSRDKLWSRGMINNEAGWQALTLPAKQEVKQDPKPHNPNDREDQTS